MSIPQNNCHKLKLKKIKLKKTSPELPIYMYISIIVLAKPENSLLNLGGGRLALITM